MQNSRVKITLLLLFSLNYVPQNKTCRKLSMMYVTDNPSRILKVLRISLGITTLHKYQSFSQTTLFVVLCVFVLQKTLLQLHCYYIFDIIKIYKISLEW